MNKVFYVIINFMIFLMIFNIHICNEVQGEKELTIFLILSNLEFDIITGTSYESYFVLRNEGSEDFNYNVTYSTIFDVDEFTQGLWSFNEGAGETVHDSTEENTLGEIIGATWVNGRFGGGLRFDGWDDYVYFTNLSYSDMSSVTLETWIKFESAEGWSPIGPVKFWEYGAMYNEQGYIRAHVWADGLKWFDVPMDLIDGSWHYVAMTYDSSLGSLSLYLDGVLLESRFEGYGVINATSNNLIIGRSWSENMWDFFAGMVDETRISNVSRRGYEIWETYHGAVDGAGETIRIIDRHGTVGASSEAEVSVIVNATDVDPGTYYRNLTIMGLLSEDVRIVVPIKLNVLPLNHDLSLESIKYEKEIEANSLTKVEAKIKNLGTVTEKDFEIKMIIEDKIVNRRTVNSIQPGDSERVTLRWRPDVSGKYKGKIIIENVEGEEHTYNNRDSIIFNVLGEPEIDVDEKEITINVTEKDAIKKNIIIRNTGTSDLEYLIYDTNSSIIFYDDMEAGIDGWYHFGEADPWERGTPKMGPYKTVSGKFCWGTDLKENYKDLTDSYLESEIIDLTRQKEPVLKFWNWYSIHSFEDRGYVEIWDEERWIRLNGDGFHGFSNGWIEQNFSLKQFVGKKIKIRFRLDTNEYIRDKGWYIDNVVVMDKHINQNDWITEYPTEGTIPPKKKENITVLIEPTIERNVNSNETLTIRSNDPKNIIVNILLSINLNYTQEHINYTDMEPEIQDTSILLLELGSDVVVDEDHEFIFTIYNITTNLTELEYVWSFYDGKQIDLYGINPVYMFSDPGIYEVLLNVYSDNVSVADSHFLHVLDITSPLADAGNDAYGKIGAVLLFNGTESWDNVGITGYVWDFGDGTNGTGVIQFHSYELEGEYIVVLRVLDRENNISTDEIIVTITSDIEDEVKESKLLNLNNVLLGGLIVCSIILLVMTGYILYRK